MNLKTYLDEYLQKFGIHQDNDIQEKLDKIIKQISEMMKDHKCKDVSDKTTLLSFLYNHTIKKLSPELTEEHGMWYTPEWIIKILWEILIHVSQLDFEKNNYHIIDPSSGTASFINYFLSDILKNPTTKDRYYRKLFHIREINFTAYLLSIFSLAMSADKETIIPHIHWGDNLISGKKNENADRDFILKQNDSDIQEFTIIITNPPWIAGQKTDIGDKKPLYISPSNSKNMDKETEYWVDERIRETFIKYTKAKNKKSFYNTYRRFVRWSLDHITKDWIAMVLPNSFLIKKVEGFRIALTKECAQIYLVDFKGAQGSRVMNSSEEGENIFTINRIQSGNTQGVCLLLCYKDGNNNDHQKDNSNKTYYASCTGDNLTKENKEQYVLKHYQEKSFFKQINLDQNEMWLNHFEKAPQTWQALCHKDVSKENQHLTNFYFKERNDGMSFSCGKFVWDDDKDNLKNKMIKFIDFYNECRYHQKIVEKPNIIKWHARLRKKCFNNIEIIFNEKNIIRTLKKPFQKEFCYFEPLIIESLRRQDKHYSTSNISLCVNYKCDIFECLVFNTIPHNGLILRTTICYPMSEIISYPPYNQKEWLSILYDLFHHEKYRKESTNFLKNKFPTIPRLNQHQKQSLLNQGLKLMHLHLNYEILYPCKDILDETEFKKLSDDDKSNFFQYHPDMPSYVPKEALQYTFYDKPLLFHQRKSKIFPQLVTMAIETAKIKKDIDSINLNLKANI